MASILGAQMTRMNTNKYWTMLLRQQRPRQELLLTLEVLLSGLEGKRNVINKLQCSKHWGVVLLDKQSEPTRVSVPRL